MFDVTCVNDAVIFKAKSKRAKFCSDKCRKAYARKQESDGVMDDLLERVRVGGDSFTTHSHTFPIPDAPEYRGFTTTVPSRQPITAITPTKVKEVKVPEHPLPREFPNAKLPTPEPYDRAKNLAAFEKMGLQQVTWITTGIPELDEFQQIPRGRVTQIQGPFAVGKTTLALNMLKGLAKAKQRVLYIDTEASLNPSLLVDLELDAKYFTLYNESAFIEDIYDEIVAASKTKDYDLIILDSLAATTTRTEEANEAGARNIGGKALIVNKLMRIVPMNLKNNDTALVIINQEREMIGTYVPTKYTPGGMGPVYAASLILGLKTIPSWRFPKDSKNGAYKGHEIEVTILKSKVSQPHRKKKIKLYYQEDQSLLNLVDEPVEEMF